MCFLYFVHSAVCLHFVATNLYSHSPMEESQHMRLFRAKFLKHLHIHMQKSVHTTETHTH